MAGKQQTKEVAGINLVSIIVRSYDEAIEFFTERLGFVLVEDSPSFTNAGQPKRWVVVRPPPLSDSSDTSTGASILLARADGMEQESVIGKQFAGRVGMFWRVEDFEATYSKLVDAGVVFTKQPQNEVYGRYAVFLDISGNKWDLIGPVFSTQ